MDDSRGSAATPLRAAVDDLLDVDLTMLAGPQLAQLLQDVETERRRLAAVDHRLLAEVVARGVAGDYGTASPTALLMQLLRVAPGEARSRLAQAGELGPRREVSGAPLEPVLPVVADAVVEGAISAAHVSVISACLARIPAAISATATPVAERFMVEAARHEHPRALARTGEILLARLDPDGRAPREDEAERRRGFDLRQRADGTSSGRGEFTAEATALLLTIFDALAAPVTGDEPDTRSASQRRHDALVDVALRLLRSGSLPAAGGVPLTVLVGVDLADLRGEGRTRDETRADNTATRRADEVARPPDGSDRSDHTHADPPQVPDGRDDNAPHPPEACDGPGGGTAPPPESPAGWDIRAAHPPETSEHRGKGGADPFDLSELGRFASSFATSADDDATDGVVRTAHGAVWSMRQLILSACEAAIVPVVLNEAGGILAYGRTRRLASSGQRLTLVARDRGCVFPGCDVPAAWCEVHHVVEWINGGSTDIANMCLLCRYHHRHFAQLGWQVRMTQAGLPEWVPPPWLDEQRRPRRNHARHRDDDLFATCVMGAMAAGVSWPSRT